MSGAAATARSRRLAVQGVWAPRQATPTEVVARLGAVQAQEFPYALWSVAQRIHADVRPSAADMVVAYDLGGLLRTHVLRPTWHFVAPADARWLLTLTAPRVRRIEAPYLAGLGIDADLLTRVVDVFAAAVAGGHHRTRQQLRDALSVAGIELPSSALPHVLMVAELERVLISGVIDGKQRTYADFDERVEPGFLGGSTTFDREMALAELAERYFTSRGPASVKDMAAWSGLTMADCRTGLTTALERSPGLLEAVEIDGLSCWMPPGAAPTAPPSPRADLVQGYDEYIMGYTETRGLMQPDGYTAPRVPVALFHALLVDGTLAGVWKNTVTRTSATLVVELLRRLAPEESAAVEDAVAEYSAYLGVPVVVEAAVTAG